jgi:hypothetical protein
MKPNHALRNRLIRTFMCFVPLLSIYSLRNIEIFRLSNIVLTATATLFSFPSIPQRVPTFAELTTHGKLLNSTPSEAFVMFCNNNRRYLLLLNKVLEAVHLFSTRPIIVYGIDVDLNLDTKKYPRLIKRRLSQKDCGPSIYFCKLHAIVDSQIDYGVYVEADTLVNWNVDILFDVLRRWPYPLPLAPRHSGDPRDYDVFLNKFEVNVTDRRTPYIHAHLSWNYRAYPFLRQALSLLRQGNFMSANYDETAINVLLWKAQANHTLCSLDPFFGALPAYESNQTICHKYCHTAYVLIHGSKKIKDMHDVLERLKKHAGSPFIQTLRHGMRYLNETQYTCCYPDSHPSPIHPLLCEHR